MFLSYSFWTLNEYYILFSILFYPKFCQPWIISEQNSKRVSKDRLRKQLLHMKIPYTRFWYELESVDAVLSRIRNLHRERLVTRSCIQMKLTFIPATPFRNADKTNTTGLRIPFSMGELLNIKFHMYNTFYIKKIVIINSFAHENME